MDELSLLLERFSESQTTTVIPPPVAAIEARACRRTARRTVTSLSLMVLLVVGLVLGLASAGLASETDCGSTSVTVALGAG